MRRRSYLRLVGGLPLLGTSGCLGYDVVETSQIESRKERISKLQQDIDEAKVRIQELEEEISRLENEIEEKNATISNLNEEIENLEDEKTDLMNRVDRLQDERSELQSELDEIKEEPVPPRISIVNLVSIWEEFGDALRNSIESINQGETARIAFRANWPVHDGKIEMFTQTTIYSQTSSVAQQTSRNEVLTDGESRDYEHWRGFRTTDWDPGTYTAEVIVLDEITNAQSEPATTTFSVG